VADLHGIVIVVTDAQPGLRIGLRFPAQRNLCARRRNIGKPYSLRGLLRAAAKLLVRHKESPKCECTRFQRGTMQHNRDEVLSKVPEVTLGFWIIKILCTTLGETGGDTVTMTWLHADLHPHNGGYLIGTGIFLALFVAAVVAQIFTEKFNPWIYWLAIVASTTIGTALADLFDRSFGIGYVGGSSILLACVLCSLAVWYFTMGSINVQTVASPKVEVFYWMTITFSQTLGTALGDWMADDTGLGYDGAAVVFCLGLAVLAALYYWTTISRVVLFWAAFILTRPLGATVGDFLDKPVGHGGLALSRPLASGVILALIVLLIIVLPQRPGRHPAEAPAKA
jgi:uncharacterized membrane-anchored protein